MSTTDYIPPAKDLRFLPEAPPLHQAPPEQKWVLEIGPGKGEFILHQAQANPKINFIAVEVRRGRFEKIGKKVEKLELNNLFLVLGDARECLPRIFPQDFFSRIYILFPDPWPKKRHIKHRLLKPRLISQLRGLLKDGGDIFSATDAGYYSEQIVSSFTEVGGFICEGTSSPYPTYFEQKWISMGRDIDYWRFVKSVDSAQSAVG